MLKALQELWSSGIRRRSDRAEQKYHLPTRISCTKDTGTVCQLLEHLCFINEILLDVGLELREDDPAGRRGDVCIGVVQASPCSRVFSPCEDLWKGKALTLLEYLLSEHHCITALELCASTRCRPYLLELLKGCDSLKRLTVCTVDRKKDAAFLTHTIKSLTQLEELSFKACNGYREWNWDTWDDQRIPENSLDLSIHHLTVLDVTDLEMSLQEARSLAFELAENNTITDLTLSFCVFRCRLWEEYEPLALYLAKEDSRLKRLTLKSKTQCCCLDETLVDAMCKMTSLEELNVDIVLDIGYSIIMVALLTKVATTNKTLRRLRLPSTVCGYCTSCGGKRTMRTFPEARRCMQSWVTALKKPEFKLRELCIDLAGFDEVDCRMFFNAVADNDVLKSVTVYSLPKVCDIDQICGMICSCGLGGLVTIKKVCVDQTVANVLLYCPEITAVTVTASHFVLKEDNLQPVIWALDVISRCGHVTSLRVDCSRFGRAAFSALARCIRGPSPLTEVDINFGSCWTEIVDDECYEIEAELFLALASNMNLAKLSLSGALVSRNNLKLLAGSARKSRYLTDFSLTSGCVPDNDNGGSCSWHTAELVAQPEHKNTALVAIQEIVARNISIVHAAVRYIRREGNTDMGAQVIELVRSHPRFLELVLDAAGGSKAQAKIMIGDALSRVRKTSLDEFMRLTGVVKKKVKCCGKHNAGKQLVDMRGKCWLHIRSFLKVSDVVRP